ncbi:hypothetical protein Patl1_17626 [Pistacia atlantica]|uniref:Uncharacterized protein n=1 Tax=Pistacia atlantica TaxID=434234 RepID=A0ACC1BZG6_9ROSI|nr:hypothetical protein Patl1_17626 [Pistacia atlantica]
MKEENYQIVRAAPRRRDEEYAAAVKQGKPFRKEKSIMVNRLTHGNASSPSFNATLVAELTMENNNFGSFKFQNGSGSLWYGIVTVGDMKIGEGLVRARETKTMKINIQVGSNGLLNNTNLTSDINSGMLKLSSHAELHGRVNLFNFVKKKKSPDMSCSMTLNLTSHAVQDLVCN